MSLHLTKLKRSELFLVLTYIQILFFIGIFGWCIKKTVCASYPSLCNEMGLAGDGDMAERGG